MMIMTIQRTRKRQRSESSYMGIVFLSATCGPLKNDHKEKKGKKEIEHRGAGPLASCPGGEKHLQPTREMARLRHGVFSAGTTSVELT